jgi:hypothetical protein
MMMVGLRREEGNQAGDVFLPPGARYQGTGCKGVADAKMPGARTALTTIGGERDISGHSMIWCYLSQKDKRQMYEDTQVTKDLQ